MTRLARGTSLGPLFGGMRPIIKHYWTGYGCLCMTYDGRKPNAQCSADASEVTCERCKENLRRIRSQDQPS